MKKHLLILLILFFGILVINACKKKSNQTNNHNQTVVCTTPANSIVCNDSVFHITTDTTYATLNNTFYSEHIISGDKGCGIEYGFSHLPSAGIYTVTNNHSLIKSDTQKVFVQYFLNGNSYTAQEGTLTIIGSGVGATVEFCKLLFKSHINDSLIVSMKTDFQ